jgi:hypothetical protein
MTSRLMCPSHIDIFWIADLVAKGEGRAISEVWYLRLNGFAPITSWYCTEIGFHNTLERHAHTPTLTHLLASCSLIQDFEHEDKRGMTYDQSSLPLTQPTRLDCLTRALPLSHCTSWYCTGERYDDDQPWLEIGGALPTIVTMRRRKSTL